MKDIIIDCDPGQDDALAILLALGSKTLNLKAITVVSGNVTVDRCYKNALKILGLANRLDIPVYMGEKKPLKKELTTLECVFGESGMAGSENWENPIVQPSKKGAVDFLIEAYSDFKEGPMLSLIAPQTNIATALIKNPTLAKKIPEITIMGGCVFKEPVHGFMGNISFDGGKTHAEYNFAMDPHAVDIVFKSGVSNINLIGLNVTRKVLYDRFIDERLRKINSLVSKRVADMLTVIGQEDKDDYAVLKKESADFFRALHDAVALAYMEDRSIFKVEKLPVLIDLTKTLGQTIIDENGTLINVVTDVDKDAFFDLVCCAISNLN